MVLAPLAVPHRRGAKRPGVKGGHEWPRRYTRSLLLSAQARLEERSRSCTGVLGDFPPLTIGPFIFVYKSVFHSPSLSSLALNTSRKLLQTLPASSTRLLCTSPCATTLVSHLLLPSCPSSPYFYLITLFMYL